MVNWKTPRRGRRKRGPSLETGAGGVNSLRLRLSRAAAAGSRLLLPPRCLVCGGRGSQGQDLCHECRDGLPWNRSCCARCGLPLPLPAANCGECLKRPPAFDATCAALRYAAPVNLLLPRFKFHQQLACGRLLGELMLEAVGDSGLLDGVDAIVPLPLHRRRLAERGYNQALELARLLARHSGLPLLPDLLHRQRPTQAQSGLDARARRRNVRGAFSANADAKGRSLLLVDDVMTTGASLREAASVLKAAGAAELRLALVARAPPPRG